MFFFSTQSYLMNKIKNLFSSTSFFKFIFTQRRYTIPLFEGDRYAVGELNLFIVVIRKIAY